MEFNDWKAEVINMFTSHSYNSNLGKKLLKYIHEIMETKELSQHPGDETKSFLNDFSTTVIRCILSTNSERFQFGKDYQKILNSYVKILDIFITTDNYEFVETSLTIFQSRNPFYSYREYDYYNGCYKINPFFLQNAMSIYETNVISNCLNYIQNGQPNLKIYCGIIQLLGMLSKKKEIEKISNVMCASLERLIQWIAELNEKDVKNINEKDLKDLLMNYDKRKQKFNEIKPQLEHMKLSLYLKYVKSGVLSKQYQGINEIKMLLNTQSDRGFITSFLKNNGFLMIMNDMHQDLVSDFSVIFDEMLRCGNATIEDFHVFWKLVCRQHPSVIEIFMKAFCRLLCGQNKTILIKEFIKTIKETELLPREVIIIVGTIKSICNSKQKIKLYQIIYNQFCNQKLNEQEENEYIYTLTSLVPKSDLNFCQSLQEECMNMIQNKQNMKYALALFNASCVRLSKEKARPYFNALIEVISNEDVEIEPYLDLIIQILNVFDSECSLSLEEFQKLLTLTEKLLSSSPEKICSFYKNLYKTLSKKNLFDINMKYTLFKTICKSKSINESFDFIKELFLDLNNGKINLNKKTKGLKYIWRLLSSSENEKIIDYVIGLYKNNQELFINEIESRINKYGCLLALQKYLIKYDGPIDLSKFGIEPNKCYLDDDFKLVSLKGEITKDIYVLNSISFSNFVDKISELVGVDPSQIYLSNKDNIEITSINFDLNQSTFIVSVQRAETYQMNYMYNNSSYDYQNFNFRRENSDNEIRNVSALATTTFMKSRCCDSMYFLLLKGKPTKLMKISYQILNSIPTIQYEKDVLINKTGEKIIWNEYLNPSLNYIFLYRMNTIGNLILKNYHNCLQEFYNTGCFKYIFELCLFNDIEKKLSFDINNTLFVLGLIKRIICSEQSREFAYKTISEFNDNDIQKFISWINEVSGKKKKKVYNQKLLSLLIFIFQSILTVNNKNVNENMSKELKILIQRLLFYSDSTIRSEIKQILNSLGSKNYQSILIELISYANSSKCDEYFSLLLPIVKEIDDPSKILMKALKVLYKYYQLPRDSFIETMMFKVPNQNFTNGLLSTLNISLRKLKKMPNDFLLDFYVDNIIFNSYKYYEPTEDLYGILNSLIEIDPNNTTKFIPKVKSITDFINKNKYQVNIHNLTSALKPRGLVNLGATCYINASLQQLFNITQLKKAILSANFDECNDWSTQIQYIFSKLEYFPSSHVDPSSFIHLWTGWDGEPINPREQQDAVEFLQMFFERLETKDKNITSIFKGQLVHTLIGRNYDYQSEIVEDFNIFPLEVQKHNNVDESLQTFLIPDKFEGNNQYKVDEYGYIEADRYHKVRIAPEILILQLKRFEYNMSTGRREKVNSHYTFPMELDLAPIMENNESQEYELTGVVMHMGSANAGHYFSYAKRDNGKWYKFNDTSVCRFDETQLPEIASGGKMKQMLWDDYGTYQREAFVDKDNNAYLLFYRKKTNTQKDNENSETVINQSCLDKLDEEIRFTILNSVLLTPYFQQLIYKLCEYDKDGTFMFSYLCKTACISSDISDILCLGEKCIKLLKESSTFADYVITQTYVVEQNILIDGKADFKKYFCSIITEALKNSSEGAKNMFSNYFLEKTDSIINYYQSFDEYFEIYNVLIEEANASISPLISLLNSTLPNYNKEHKELCIYQSINFSSIFKILSSTKFDVNNLKSVLTSDNVLNFLISPIHAESLSNLIDKLGDESENLILNIINENVLTESQYVSLFLIVFLLNYNKSSLSTIINSLTSSLLKQQNLINLVFKDLTVRIPSLSKKVSKSFNLSFEILKQFLLHKDKAICLSFNDLIYSIYYQFPKLSLKVVEKENKEDFHDFFLILLDCKNDFESFLKNKTEGEAVVPLYYKLLNWILTSGGFVTDFYNKGNDFVISLKKCIENNCTKSYQECFDMIFNCISINGSSEEFFKVVSFNKFINSIPKTININGIQRILNIISKSKLCDFFKSDLISSILIKSIQNENLGKTVNDFIKANVDSENVNIICSSIWNKDLFEVSLDNEANNYYQISWYLLKKFPQTSAKFYSNKCHEDLLQRIYCEIRGRVVYDMFGSFKRVGNATLPQKLTLLAHFNNSYIDENKNKKGIFNKISKLSKFYKDNNNKVFFDCIIKDIALQSPDKKGSQGFFKFLISLFNLDYYFCQEIFNQLIKTTSNSGHFLKNISYEAQKGAAELLVNVIFFVMKKEQAKEPQCIELLCKEFYSYVKSNPSNFEIADILCGQIRDVIIKADVNSNQYVSNGINFIYEKTRNIQMMSKSILAVALMIKDANPKKWLRKSEEYLIETIYQSQNISPQQKPQLENICSEISTLIKFINQVSIKYHEKIPPLNIDINIVFDLASKIQMVGETVENSDSATELIKLVTSFEN